MNHTNNKKKKYQAARLLYMAFVVSLFIYTLVVEVFSGQVQDFSRQTAPTLNFMSLRYIFYGIAIALIIFMRSLRGSLLKNTPPYTAAVITAAFCETPAILGLVFFFLTGIKRDFYFLLIISLILLFMYFPRYSSWGENHKPD